MQYPATREYLIAQGYELQFQMHLPELASFVRTEIQHSTTLFTFYHWLTRVLGVAAAAWLGVQFVHAPTAINNHLVPFFLAFGGVLALVPVHEALHGLAYKWVGAPQVSYGAKWDKLLFFAIADGFALGHRAFRVVALAPFVVISMGLILSLILVPTGFKLFFFTLLFIHTAVCLGDFALLNYFQRHDHTKLITVDRAQEDLTEFWLQSTKA